MTARRTSGCDTATGSGRAPETPTSDASTALDGPHKHVHAGPRLSDELCDLLCMGHVWPGPRFMLHSSTSAASDIAPRQSTTGAADNTAPWHTSTATAY